MKATISLEICNTLDSHNIHYHERSHSWYAWDFYQANQLEIKLHKKSTQAFCFGQKLWPLLEISEISISFQTNSFWDKIGGICS